jgi:YVTN family beta-propeller protein
MKTSYWKLAFIVAALTTFILAGRARLGQGQETSEKRGIPLPSSKILLSPAPGHPQPTNSFPTALALSPDGRYIALLNNGRGVEESGYQQSIAIVDLASQQVRDFPDSRLKVGAKQSYFLGLAFSSDGKAIYASIASLNDPTGQKPDDTGNGIAVYSFQEGTVAPQWFIKLPLPPLEPGKQAGAVFYQAPKGMAVPYPAGLAVIPGEGGDKLLVAENLADDAILLDVDSGQVLKRFDLSVNEHVPGSYPYGVAVTRDGQRGYCSLWNASQVAELDLNSGEVARRISLQAPDLPTAAGSHPTALLLSPDEKRLYITLANADAVAVIDTATRAPVTMLSTKLPGQNYAGTYPNALAESADGKRLFVAAASLDAVAVFDLNVAPSDVPQAAMGFIPTEWYPTALAVQGDDLLIASGKGQGTGPNSRLRAPSTVDPGALHPYIASLIRGSIAKLSIRDAERSLAQSTNEVLRSNLMLGRGDTIPFQAGSNLPANGHCDCSKGDAVSFQAGSNPIKHVIYIIKENRTYDQVFGDLRPGDGDPALCMYGEKITPNEHELARQFGVLDNFYCSGEVSGNGHVWSMAAITSDYTEKTWQISYRGSERLYDYEGIVSGDNALRQGQPDVNEPGTGYIWTNVARHGLTHRNYGEYVDTHWCDMPPGANCAQKSIHPGEPLPANVGQPHGSPSPWPWPVPVIIGNVATKPEIEDHFDPRFADFRCDYPDQLRADEFLNEFTDFVKALQEGTGTPLPQFVILRLPNDHTIGALAGYPRPEASVADNDLAVGRVVEAVSHSPYWDDTAIFILEDDAQDGADHVDAHRSTALVISKYSPSSTQRPFVEHNFYTTVNMVHTMEVLLGLPPMNNNDAQAAVMAPLFSGTGDQPPFNADSRNLRNGLIYKVNAPKAPGAKESARMDFSHADAADPAQLNAILWRASKGNVPMPKPVHTVIRDEEGAGF